MSFDPSFVLVDKASEWTSHDVVGKARRIFGLKKIGHAEVGYMVGGAWLANNIKYFDEQGFIAIGMPTVVTKIFSMCMPYDGLRKTVARFLGAYTLLAGDDL